MVVHYLIPAFEGACIEIWLNREGLADPPVGTSKQELQVKQ